MKIEWGAVVRPKQGQVVSGDVYVVVEAKDQSMLVAVIDGLGGGHEAAHAATLAANVFRDNPHMPLQDLVKLSHAHLHATRGAVASLLRLYADGVRASYVGVGNIGAQVYSTQAIKPISKNGILGFKLPSLLELQYTYDHGDIFVLYSDGISSSFSYDNKVDLTLPAQQIAESILSKYGKFSDDASVIVVKT